mmetsp:Transcript_51694/g.85039  ORF Transcript_51694/g.85039 Transcript_51694/m.85039 type:complete len:90 (-) Transcript_51694:996-1265(-)
MNNPMTTKHPAEEDGRKAVRSANHNRRCRDADSFSVPKLRAKTLVSRQQQQLQTIDPNIKSKVACTAHWQRWECYAGNPQASTHVQARK